MNASDLTNSWAKKELTTESIQQYLQENLNVYQFHGRDTVKHVADLCYSLYQRLTGQIDSVGSFLTAVLQNDLKSAVLYADEHNRQALWIYPAFLYEVAPGNWRDILKDKTDGSPD